MASVHLLVLLHGMWGNTDHLAELERIATETHESSSVDGISLHILKAETIKHESTYDGIDWGGERVAKEVLQTVDNLAADGKRVVRFSVTGYSLGGLIARYLIGVLAQKGFFNDVEPVNFNTIATPHAGLPRYPSFLSCLASSLGPKLLSRTGEQFYIVDKWSPKGRPLLVVMADPERIFYQTLAKFKHIRIYANSINDITVPYVTAAIETSDPFADREITGLEIKFQEKYKVLVESYSQPEVPPPRPPKPTLLTPAWFQSLKPSTPFLPPWLQFRFPLNLVIYAFVPVLIPTIFTLLITNLFLAGRKSRARIQELEAEYSTSKQQRLVDLLEELEQEVEEAAVELIDNDDPSPSFQSPKPSKTHPIITPNHRKIAGWLNTLPIEKVFAFFPNVRNSHAMIVSRDVRRFEWHRQGEGVLRHWATSFVL